MIPTNAPFLVIDVQRAFDHLSWGKRNNLEAENNIVSLIDLWRKTDRPIIYVRHISNEKTSLFYMHSITSNFKEMIIPNANETVIHKKVNSAFIGTNLEEILRGMRCTKIVVTGLTTNHCVETTTRMAGNLGFNPILVSDATATFDRKGVNGEMYDAETIHQMSLANLNGEFAEIMDTKTILELLVKSEVKQ
ncbi:cysteine hydrolase family protein [Alkalihalobacillus sp. AL-G]|uniref:cysteine hydrolase family protein n=1 Tax=Alkalihalobacillus sp. AL-G TaxID=2926399 RepID=UPI00272AEFC8|nr:cysteine hydrolase family protein [Alkalihalobacillus sp. AL-G]WLD94380.1 cysteine hydrolase [Alkalihalobacillus sp. AL-G]